MDEEKMEIQIEIYYLSRFDHEQVRIKLMNGEEIRGKLHISKENRYDVLLEIKEGEKILIFKHNIVYIAIDVPLSIKGNKKKKKDV